jgi:hypothetical protein
MIVQAGLPSWTHLEPSESKDFAAQASLTDLIPLGPGYRDPTSFAKLR